MPDSGFAEADGRVKGRYAQDQVLALTRSSRRVSPTQPVGYRHTYIEKETSPVKRFESRLERVLQLRRQQVQAERTHLENVQAALDLIAQEIRSLHRQLEEARAHVRHAPSAAGEDHIALSHFESHIQRRVVSLDQRREQIAREVAEQRAKALQAERKLALAERLEGRKRSVPAAAGQSRVAAFLQNRRPSTV